MKGDFLSYRVAASRAVLGLVLQAGITAALLVFAFRADNHAAMTAVIYSAIGLPVWLALAIVFDQHRRERVEAMEAETLAAGGGTSSIFNAETGEFRVARNRLAAMYKYFLPTVSVVEGALLIGAGFWRLAGAREIFHPSDFPEQRLLAWATGLGFIIAVVGFIFARYVSGMAKQPVWQNLRAGGAWAVGTALMGLFIAVGAVIDIAGPNAVSRWITVVYPVALIVLGCEVFLNFLLDLYRPRRAGEVPRPAFDSRVLGFVAAPDRIAQSISDAINYQLGFDVSSTWFYQLLSRSVGRLVLLAAVVLWGLTCLAVVQPHERAMVLRFGRVVDQDLGPGLHFKLPWPIDRVEVPAFTRRNDRGRVEVAGHTATGVRSIDLGSPPPADEKKAILWTNEHAREEIFQIVQPSSADTGGADGTVGAARDIAMVSVEVPLQYAVKNVELFDRLAPPEFRDDLIRAVAQRQIVQFFSGMDVDAILGGDQTAISRQLRARVVAALDAMNPDPAGGAPLGSGVDVLFVGVTGVHPPKDAAPNFERVVQAEQLRQAKMESARADAIESLTKVVGSLDLANRVVTEVNEVNRLREEARRGDAGAGAKVPEQEARVLGLLEQAGGKAAEEVAQARADRWARHMSERGRALRYRGQLASFEAAPQYYRASVYFDTLQQAMANNRVYIVSDTVPVLWFHFDLQDRDVGANVLDTTKEENK